VFLCLSEKCANGQPSTVGFVIGFSTFLLRCVDYSRVHSDHVTRLSDIVVERCVSRYAPPHLFVQYIYLFIRRFSGFTLLFFLLFCAFYVWQIALFVLSVMRLADMYRFYTHLLQIPDVRIPSMYLRSSPNISVGRHPDYLMARSRSSHRSHPQFQSTHRAILIIFATPRQRSCETRRARHRQPYYATRKLPHRTFQQRVARFALTLPKWVAY
jgi:hypothetical protein